VPEKIFRIIRNLCSPLFYREIYRKQLYFLYEHCLPLKEMQMGNNLEIHPTATFRFGENITIEDSVVIDAHCAVWASPNSKITVRENVGIGPNTVIISSNHSFGGRGNYLEQPLIEKNIIVEKNAWIGANSVILAGVTIGEGAVIGAGAVVSKDVPKFSFAVSPNRNLIHIERR